MKKLWNEKITRFKPTNGDLAIIVAGTAILQGYIKSLEQSDDVRQFLADVEALHEKLMRSFTK